MKLRFFGRLRDQTGGGERDIDPPAEIETADKLRLWLGRDLPQLLDPSVRMALGDRLIHSDQPLGDAVEISFLPPVSGG